MVFLPIAGLALGAAGMYLFDPEKGRGRRAQMRDRAGSRVRRLRHGADAAVRDLRNRARGMRHGWRGVREGEIPDRVLTERVRTKLGRYSSHPGAIRVAANHGTVELSGAALAHECDTLLRVVRRVRGVQAVRDRIERHHDPAHVSALQGGVPRSGEHNAFMRERWSPSARMLSGGAGSALVLLAMRRRGLAGALAGAAGAALLLRATTNSPLRRLSGEVHPHRAGTEGGSRE